MGKKKEDIGVFMPEGELEKQLPFVTILLSALILRGAANVINWAETKLGEAAKMVEARRKIVIGEMKRRE